MFSTPTEISTLYRVGKIWEIYWGSVAKRVVMSHGRLPYPLLQADNLGNKVDGVAVSDSTSGSTPVPLLSNRNLLS